MSGHQRPLRRKQKQSFRPLVEELESRVTPSGGVATTSFHIKPMAQGGSSPSGYTPLQILEAYNFYSTTGTNNISFNGVAGNGAGQTIAIVDAYNDPNIASDLAAFDAQFHLAAPASLKVTNEQGQTTSLPGADSSGGWEMEEALDVEWAHAIAPGASIVLVEASSASDSDLDTAVTTAAKMAGVSVVSMSWSGGEFSGETSQDSVFTTPSGHQGVTFLAATGDSGAPAGYPAFSPNVVAVGGTSLYLNSNYSYQSESAWSGSGGGVSTQESEPAYQLSVQSTGKRTVPDVSFVANPNTGVAIYDSYDNSSGPWTQIGGTSLSTPSWAAVVAIINQGRVAAGGTTLNGATQTLPALYSLPSSAFHDVTTGNDGTYSAAAGYDEVTGLGTPVATSLIPDMVAYGNVGPAAKVVAITQPPASVAQNASFTVSFAIEDANGNVLTSDNTDSVTVSFANNPGAATLGGTATATVKNGVATFSTLTVNKAGTGYTLQAKSGSFTSAPTSAFAVTSAATHVQVTVQPASSESTGAPFSVTVAAEDANGNVVSTFTGSITVSLAANPGAATLGGTLTATASNGQATFSNLTLNKPGAGYKLQFAATGLTSATSNAFNVVVVGARVVVTAQPAGSATAGAPFGFSVAVEDSLGNIATGFSGNLTVALSANPGSAALNGTLTVPVTNGTAQFTGLSINTAANGYTLSVTGAGLTSATTSSINITAGTAAKLAVTTQPASTVTTGAAFTVVVAVEDAYGNIATGYTGTVAIALLNNPASATLGGTLTASVVNGLATFSNLTLNQVGSGYTLQATVGTLTAATTNAFNVAAQAAQATQLVITTEPPSSVQAGAGFTVNVSVEDASGNVVTGYTGTVTIAIAGDPAGGSVTVSVVNGVASFYISLSGSGTMSLQATATGLTSATTTPITVTRGHSRF